MAKEEYGVSAAFETPRSHRQPKRQNPPLNKVFGAKQTVKKDGEAKQ